MPRPDVKLTGKTVLSDAWSRLTRYAFEIERHDGTWQHLVREVNDHGHAAAILLVNRRLGTVVLTRQFRLPVHLEGDESEVLEVCAGLLDGDTPESCAEREAAEETGYRVHRLQHVMDVYASPGALTEKLHLFIGEYDRGDTVSDGGGLAHEGEDIEVVEMPFAETLQMIERGEIIDAKTVLLLQHAALKGLFD